MGKDYYRQNDGKIQVNPIEFVGEVSVKKEPSYSAKQKNNSCRLERISSVLS
jgi:hypothetical protein